MPRRPGTPVRSLAVASVVAALAALTGAAPAERASGTPKSRLLVDGHPHASRFPAAGIADRVDR